MHILQPASLQLGVDMVEASPAQTPPQPPLPLPEPRKAQLQGFRELKYGLGGCTCPKRMCRTQA